MTATSTSRSAGVGFRSERGPILIGLMLSSALVALDATILATAAATISRDFAAFDQVPWLFSAYTLAQAVTVPVYGRLADVLGRKRLMIVGILLFIAGSVLCAVAWNMPSLVAFRVVQGLGAGAIAPMSMTIVSDIYTLAERAKMQGYLASVWAIASVVGPTLGGVFSEFVSWRWIFWINVPLGLLAATLLWRKFHEKHPATAEREPIDYRGAALLTIGSAMLIGGLLQGSSWGWSSWPTVAVFAAAVTLLSAFVIVARRVSHPIFNLRILRRRIVATSTIASLMIGVIVLGLSTYVPIYAQGVLGAGPLTAGFALAAFTFGWPLTATISGRIYLRVGFRSTALIGSSLVVVGSALTLLLGAGSEVWHISPLVFIIGAGMGLTNAPTLIAAQASAGWAERGAVTGTNMFARSLGSAVGVAIFGALVNATTVVGTDGTPEGPGLADGIHLVFWCALVVAVVLWIAVALMPRVGRPDDVHD